MIHIEALSKWYETMQGRLEVFSGLSLDIPDKQIVAVLGPSGCGKTTLLHILAGMEPYDSGKVEGIPKSSTTTVASLSYLFQEPRLLPWLNVYENVELVLQNHIPDAYERKARALRFIELVGLSEYCLMKPSELSGGMRQRVSIARAFAYPSRLILMDEPFQSLDTDLRYQLIESYRNLWQRTPRTTILVTHDIQEALLLADRVVVLSQRPAAITHEFKVDIPAAKRAAGSRELLEIAMGYYEKIYRRG